MDAPRLYRTQKRPEPLLLLGFPAFVGLRWIGIWWRWRESNPRPKAIDAQYYMLSSPFDLVFRQYDVRNAPVDQSEKFRHSSVRRRNQAIS